MQKTTVGSIEITALVDLVQAYPAATVYPELGDGARFSGYLDAEGKVALGFASYLVRDGETGFTIPDQEPEALCEKLSWLLNDKELHATMSKRAVEYAQDYAWEKIAKQIVDVY